MENYPKTSTRVLLLAAPFAAGCACLLWLTAGSLFLAFPASFAGAFPSLLKAETCCAVWAWLAAAVDETAEKLLTPMVSSPRVGTPHAVWLIGNSGENFSPPMKFNLNLVPAMA